MKLDFKGRHVVVTGGTGSLGSAVVKLLIDAGASCSIPCYDASELDDFAYRDHDNLFCRTGIDLTDEDAAATFYEGAAAHFGEPWASVHLAGGFGMGSIGDTDRAAFMRQINLNLLTCYISCRAAIGHIRKGGDGGRLVNVASRPALEPRQGAGMSAYTAAKAGVAALTRSLAAEVAEEDILVNAIAPSIIDTGPNREAMPEADHSKWPKPEEIATQVAYLASPQNHVTRGAVVPVYGKS